MNHCAASPYESILYECDGEIAAQVVTQTLTRHGFYVVRSFDLRSALAAHGRCECPQHGTAKCTCQFVVLLVYSPCDILAVTVHSREGKAQVQIVRPVGMLRDEADAWPEVHMVEQIRAALLGAALTAQTAPVPRLTEVSTDVRQES